MENVNNTLHTCFQTTGNSFRVSLIYEKSIICLSPDAASEVSSLALLQETIFSGTTKAQ